MNPISFNDGFDGDADSGDVAINFDPVSVVGDFQLGSFNDFALHLQAEGQDRLDVYDADRLLGTFVRVDGVWRWEQT